MRPLAVLMGLLYGLAAFFVTALALCLWVQSRGVRDAEVVAAVPTSSPPPIAEPPRPSPDAMAPVAATPAAGGELARASAGEPEVPPPPPEPEPVDDGLVALRGRAVAIDPAGAEHSSEDGAFDLEYRSGEGFTSVAIAVRGGRFEQRVPKETRFKIGAVELGARTAQPEDERLPDDLSGELALRFRWLPGSMLRVVASDTQADLAEVDVVTGLAGQSAQLVHPGAVPPERIAFRGARSPIALADVKGRKTYWARAPGYAWGRIEIDHASGGERVLALQPSGSVSVTFDGLRADSGAALRLYGGRAVAGVGPVFEAVPTPGEPIVIEDLAAGAYEARLEVGGWARDPDLLGAAEFALARDAHADVVIALEPPAEAPTPVEVHGRVVLHGSYPGLEPTLVISALEHGAPSGANAVKLALAAMAVASEDPLTLRWSAGPLAPRAYLFEVRPLSLREVREVRADPDEEVVIEVPAPAELALEVADAESGEPLVDALAQWHRPPPAGVTNWEQLTARADPQTHRIRIAAPAGAIALTVRASGYAPAERKLELAPGTNELQVRLERACAVRIALDDAGTVLPCGASFRIEAREVDGSGSATSWGVEGSACLVGVSNPGLYEVSVSGLSGYQVPAPQRAQLERGRPAEIVFHLQRAP